jgi:hypothetical protein
MIIIMLWLKCTLVAHDKEKEVLDEYHLGPKKVKNQIKLKN